MASNELQRLWKLHQIDAGLADVRARAAALSPGRELMAEVKRLEEQDETIGGAYRKLRAELTDLELAKRSAEDKVKATNEDLYSGRLVIAREAQDKQRELEMLTRQIEKAEHKIGQLRTQIIPAEKEANAITEQLTAKKKELVIAKKKALETRGELEARFAQLNELRPNAAKIVPPALLARYEVVRKSHGTGMALITKKQTCEGCGMSLPEKTIITAKDDKLVTCQSCHRILYFTAGLV